MNRVGCLESIQEISDHPETVVLCFENEEEKDDNINQMYPINVKKL